MRDHRRIAGLAIVLLVGLRLCIGWQLLYEGLWKWDTQDSPNPWTARGFLANSQGPMRGVFRGMTGDPDDVDWLGYVERVNDKGEVTELVPKVQLRWDEWLQEFGHQYELTPEEFGRVSRVVQGREVVTSQPFDMPDDVEITGQEANLVNYDEETRRLTLQTAIVNENGWFPKRHLIPANRVALLELVEDVNEDPAGSGNFTSEYDNESHVAFATAVHELYESQKNLSYFERLRAMVLGNPENATVVNAEEEFAGSVDAKRIGKIDQYRTRLARYEEQLANADIAFQRSHLEREFGKLQEMKAELVGPIKQLEAEMKAEALSMLTAEQRALGPPPEPWTSQRIADTVAIWSLMVLGLLLMIGLATRFAAVLAGGMLLTFYMVWPPFPGVPEAPGPEHALFVNKNFIEAVALFAIAAMPTGTWFGLDGLFSGRRDRRELTAVERLAAQGKSKPAEEAAAEKKSKTPTYKTRDEAKKT